MSQKPSYRPPHWRCVEDAYLLSIHSHMTLKEMAEQLKTSVTNIQDRLREMNVNKSAPPKGDYRYQLCANPICFTLLISSKDGFCSKECNIVYETVNYPTKKAIKKLYDAGKDVYQIARSFDMSITTILHLMQRYEIDRKGFVPVGDKSNKNKGQSVSVGGIREDLGNLYVRSRWEANALRYLNLKKIPWEFEPKMFEFEKIKRGTRTYTPDVLIYPGTKKEKWIEVKGRLRPQDKTKIKRFKKYFPEEFDKLTAITKNPRVEATRFFKEMGVPIYMYYEDIRKKYSNRIKYWEG